MFYPPHAIRSNLFGKHWVSVFARHVFKSHPFRYTIHWVNLWRGWNVINFTRGFLNLSFISANTFPPDWGKWSLGPAVKFVGSMNWKALISICTSYPHFLCHYSFVFSELENIAWRYYSFGIERTYNKASGDLEGSPISQWTNSLFMFQLSGVCITFCTLIMV